MLDFIDNLNGIPPHQRADHRNDHAIRTIVVEPIDMNDDASTGTDSRCLTVPRLTPSQTSLRNQRIRTLSTLDTLQSVLPRPKQPQPHSVSRAFLISICTIYIMPYVICDIDIVVS